MDKTETRKPVVAGQFYPASAQELKRQISQFIPVKPQQSDCIGCMLPHAGYMYSGRVAGETVSRVALRDTAVLLGPNHTGNGEAFSIMTRGFWETPLGQVPIDEELAGLIAKNSSFLKIDPLAHKFEHSLEVELPFLQYLKPDLKIVPIAFLSDDVRTLKDIGREIADTITKNKRGSSVTVIASSDMTHYEPQAEAKLKDREAIEAILGLSEDRLVERIRRLSITMCGYAPVIVMLSCVRHLGARCGTLVKYETSGDITGDTESVVGYAGIIIQ